MKPWKNIGILTGYRTILFLLTAKKRQTREDFPGHSMNLEYPSVWS